MSGDAVIQVERLVKAFGAATALDGLDLSVAKGEVHGFLGPNGAGKSTTIRILLGLLRADAGRVSVLGREPWTVRGPGNRGITYVPGDVALWPTLTGGEIIDLLCRLHGRTNATRRTALIEDFQLDPTKKAKAYSKGNRQKVALIAAFAVDAELLILDEPTSGLDPLMEGVFRDCVRDAVGRGATVLLSSHILSEVETLCQRVTIVAAGRTIESGSLVEMRHLSRNLVDATVRDDPPSGLETIAGVTDVRIDDHRVRCQADSAALPQLTAALGRAGLLNLECRPPSLEELFLRHYGTPQPAGRR